MSGYTLDWLRHTKPASDKFDASAFDASDRKRRTPTGQTIAKKFPHLEYAEIPDDEKINLDAWNLRVFGEVEHPCEIPLSELLRFTSVRQVQDFHCITGWSILDTAWNGTPGIELVDRVVPRDTVTTVLVHGLDEFSTCLWLEDFLQGVIAWGYNDAPLARHHGFPLRFIAPPHLWQYKSCKWVTGLEFRTEHVLGFWEIRAYSDSAKVWENDRYANPLADEGKPMGAIKSAALKAWREEKARRG